MAGLADLCGSRNEMKVTSEAEVSLVPRSQMPPLRFSGRRGERNREGKAKGGRDHCLLPFPVIPLTSGGSAQVTYCRKTAWHRQAKLSLPQFLPLGFHSKL